jgi:5-methylthioadenosine/S-adenosylhomocysteine deaminase
MSLFRGIADDLKLQDWLNNFIFPPKRRTSRPISCAGARAWLVSKCCFPVPPLSPTCITSKTWSPKSRKKPACAACWAKPSSDFPVADAKTPADALKFSEKFLIRFHNDPLVVPAIAPHAPYTNSDDTLKAARALANKYNAPILIHISETKKENDDSQAQRHKPHQTLNSIGFFNGRTVAAHCVWVDAKDRDILKAKNVGVAHCPSSNMKLASGAAPVVGC